MTFNEIVSEVCDRLNLTSDEAKARIGRSVNSRYKRVTSSIGVSLSRRAQVSKVVTIGSRDVVFTGVSHLDNVIDKSSGKDDILEEITLDEMHELNVSSGVPKSYAIVSVTVSTITVRLNATPATAYTLYADALTSISTLNGANVPAFAEDFHDVLIFGVCADEYRKMEKIQLARDAEADFERRLSDLRMFLAKSAYLALYPSKTEHSQKWWKN